MIFGKKIIDVDFCVTDNDPGKIVVRFKVRNKLGVFEYYEDRLRPEQARMLENHLTRIIRVAEGRSSWKMGFLETLLRTLRNQGPYIF